MNHLARAFDQQNPIVIVSQARTPMGSLLGSLKDVTGPELAATAIRAVLEASRIKAEDIDSAIFGCVLSAGIGQAPARQAALFGGLTNATDATTVNKMCGSGMKALMLAASELSLSPEQVIIAGGLESMSNAPYLLPKARGGYRLGHQQVIDHMFLDGLEDAYQKGKLMGFFAEQTAKKFNFTREQQDAFAITSLQRALKANQDGTFAKEIAPVSIKVKNDTTTIVHDQQPFDAKIEKIPTLKPAFVPDGTVTAANSSSISDGAAALILMRLSEAQKRGLTPLAKIVGCATHSHEPEWFTTAPIEAIKKVLEVVQWQSAGVDLYEINEAFAVVTMAAMQALSLPHDKVNVHGGACALGHPIGASGARIVITLINALQQRHLKRGIAALCIGGGEGTALAIERM